MAELMVINATKVNGSENAYVGTVGGDGYIYFNDADFYRFKQEGTWEDNAYVLNRTRHSWTKTTMFTKLSGVNANSGGGSVAPGGEGVEYAISWMTSIVNDNSHGYDWDRRDDGTDYDCSSLVSWAFREAGYNIPLPSPSTREFVEVFTAAGFTWLPGEGNDVSTIYRGDILLSIQNHVALYIGEQQLLEANINEFGMVRGGKIGDQTGQELRQYPYYPFPWDGVLRAPAA